MATNQYLSSNKTSFFSVEDDDIDDDDFLKLSRNNRSSSSGGNGAGNQVYNDMEKKKQALIEKKKEVEQQSVLSSQRALQMLRESEDVGIATADELYHQREQLEQTNSRLDDINTTLKQSQKHIQGIRSVFGGIKNFLSKSKSETLSSPSTSSKPVDPIGEESTTKRELHEAITKAKQSDQGYNHPGLKLRNINDPTESRSAGDMDSQAILDRNMDEMVSSLGRLKGLALGLGEEIESQNDLVENIISKSERADINIQRQNKDMNRLLKK
uniref:Synaptosomal-associated protein 29 n=1 Tax=Cacopsylla melanoneura TaxID=428564 RepID=A0A8D8YJU1_9HEMI